MSIGYVSAVADVACEKFYFPPRVVVQRFSSLRVSLRLIEHVCFHAEMKLWTVL